MKGGKEIRIIKTIGNISLDIISKTIETFQ